MNPSFRPMLAAALPSEMVDGKPSWPILDTPHALYFPVLATPKVDGIRCVTLDGVSEFKDGISLPVTRSLKSIPNEFIRRKLATLPSGLDGELVTYDTDLFTPTKVRSFNNIQSDVMSEVGNPEFKFLVFDYNFLFNPRVPYVDRVTMLNLATLPNFCEKLMPTRLDCVEDLLAYETMCIEAGYEGVCFRTLNSPYKHGRSTLRQQWLVKMKRFITSEAVIIGMNDEMGNNNPIAYNALGYAERSSHGVNMRAKGRMGSLQCCLPDGRQFKIGTGFDVHTRNEMWANANLYIGKTVTFKHQPFGAKELPRIPVYVGIRRD